MVSSLPICRGLSCLFRHANPYLDIYICSKSHTWVSRQWPLAHSVQQHNTSSIKHSSTGVIGTCFIRVPVLPQEGNAQAVSFSTLQLAARFQGSARHQCEHMSPGIAVETTIEECCCAHQLLVKSYGSLPLVIRCTEAQTAGAHWLS
jgi:hypothetical protein